MSSTTVAPDSAVTGDRATRAAGSARAAFATRQVLARFCGKRPATRSTFAAVATVAVLAGVSACAAPTARPRTLKDAATSTAIAAVAADQSTPSARTADAAKYAVATVTTVAKSSGAPTVAAATIHTGATDFRIAAVTGDSAVPTRIATSPAVVAIATVADKSAAMTTRADSGTITCVVGEPVAAQQTRIGVLRISIFEEQVNASC